MVMLWIIIPVFIAYALLILYYWKLWKAVPEYSPSSAVRTIPVSVVIPARNEEKKIGALLDALRNQSYPRQYIEVIVVDDQSEDGTAAVVTTFREVKLIRLDAGEINSYKKKAIETGIASASHELVICTDADCLPSSAWIESIVSFQQDNNAVFIAAPVAILGGRSVLHIFQSIDFMVLQGITAGVVHARKMSMCNGANLSYTRSAFSEVGGFSGVDHIASGDDMLLMHKIACRFPGQVKYLKSASAMVSSHPMDTWRTFINQRIRWASKAGAYNDPRILPVLILVYAVNLSFPALLIAGFFDHAYWISAGAFWIAKTLVELPFFTSVAHFYQMRWAIPWLFLLQPLHIGYTIVAGFFGQVGRYEWKGRKVK